MNYFNHITSLSDLKKQYRALTLANHPDRGGNTESMQRINAEFEKLYNVWKSKPAATETMYTGYENDYNEATAQEYTEHVYNEYRWKGSRYNGQDNKEITANIRKWLKETYPDYKFSVRLHHYSSIYVSILIADFEMFKPDATSDCINVYHIDKNKNLTDRAKEVFNNIADYVNSYRYDNSDAMTDYFDTNFYFSLEAGNGDHPYRIEVPKSRRTGGKVSPEFKRPEGPAHKAIRKALGTAYFAPIERKNGMRVLLGVDKYYSEKTFYTLDYSSYAQANKRANKLTEAGIITRIIGNKYYSIEFVGYTPEIEKALVEEDRAADAAQKEWERKQQPASETPEEAPAYGDSEKSQDPETPAVPSSFSLVDYSEKAVALFGNTRAIKDRLKELGGRFNPGLNDGGSKRAGWIFSKRKESELINLLNSVAV